MLMSRDGAERRASSDEAHGDHWDGARYTSLFAPTLRLVQVGEDGAAHT